MEKINLNEYLASNEYPGRGIAVAMAPDGRQMFIGYFIMGRSENSRNRVFDPVPERGGICTIAADPAKLEDPSLIIYNPVLTLGKTHIVTNGDQTDTIYDLMSQGKSFADALRTRTFEPDGPNYTPRISAVVYADGSYQMSILKSADGNGDSVQRYFFDYPQPVAGEGHFISTYKHNGNPIPSFEGEPLRFACPRTIGDFAHGLWSSLNPDNKVSLFARVIDLDTGESGDMIFNKYDPVCSDLDDPEEPELLPEELELLKKLDAGRRINHRRYKEDAPMNELALKYGCNPNQKPSPHLYGRWLRPARDRAERQARLHQFSGCPQLHPAGQGAESRLRSARSGLLQARFPAGAALGLPLTDVERRMYHIAPDFGALSAGLRLCPCPRC